MVLLKKAAGSCGCFSFRCLQVFQEHSFCVPRNPERHGTENVSLLPVPAWKRMTSVLRKVDQMSLIFSILTQPMANL